MKCAFLFCVAHARTSRFFHPTVARTRWSAPTGQAALLPAAYDVNSEAPRAAGQRAAVRIDAAPLPWSLGIGAVLLAGVGGIVARSARVKEPKLLLRGDAKAGTASRRALCGTAAAAAFAGAFVPAASWAAPKTPKEAQTLRDAAAAMQALVDDKDGFIAAYSAGREDAPSLPAQVPFATFQKLEKDAEPEFMEAAIDYAEAFRGAKDLVKLAKLTKQKVVVSTKDQNGEVRKEEMSYGDAPGSGLAPAKEYAERAINEVIGAKVALDAALKFYQGA